MRSDNIIGWIGGSTLAGWVGDSTLAAYGKYIYMVGTGDGKRKGPDSTLSSSSTFPPYLVAKIRHSKL